MHRKSITYEVDGDLAYDTNQHYRLYSELEFHQVLFDYFEKLKENS